MQFLLLFQVRKEAKYKNFQEQSNVLPELFRTYGHIFRWKK